MKKYLQTLLITLLVTSIVQAQIIFQEDFESPGIPNGWIVQSNATDGGWKVGLASALSSNYFTIASNGSTRIAATNDDKCNCDKGTELFITPPIDLTNQSNVVLKFDAFYGGKTDAGIQENATIDISVDGVTWQVLEDLHGHEAWDTHIIDLSDYAGEDSVYIAFVYHDGGGYLYGFAIDNVSIEVPLTLDVNLANVKSLPYGEENIPVPINVSIYNNGITEITSLEVSYSINGVWAFTETLDNVISIAPFEYFLLEFSTPWTPDAAGDYTVGIAIVTVNGNSDENQDNDNESFDSKIYEKITPPNRIDEFIIATPVLTEVADISNQLNKPTDLDFFPILGRDELWVINQRNESSGGSTLTISDASADTPTDFLNRVDDNAWHFMSLPTGIAFSPDNFNFATSPGVQDANHNNGTFTGPTLWSSDPTIYTQPSGTPLGSHMDMLHGSPFSMGIAHEVDNVFWVYDDWNKDIVRYDFAEDHGPGNDDHSDGIVRRYKNIGIDADGDIPNHMILDKATGWLYFVDNGKDRVMRLDINSGSLGNFLPLINEPLAEHSQIIGFTVETIIDAGLDRPCGIEIMENRLLVGDYANGDIIVFDMDNNFEEIGRIATENTGLTGIKIGPDGSIWYTNRLQNSLMKAQPGEFNSTSEEGFQANVKVSPNPTPGAVTVSIPGLNLGTNVYFEVSDLSGKKCLEATGMDTMQRLDLSTLPGGMYLLTVRTDQFSTTKKVVLER